MAKNLWNPWHGCRKCSPGCKNCYVFYLDSTRGQDAGMIYRSKTNFDLPLKKNRAGSYKVLPHTELATCFTSDFFLEEADEWRAEAWSIIKKRPDVNFLICTKRIHRFDDCIPDDWNDGYDNVRIAVSCENQEMADKRLPFLINIKAKTKYIFAAPLLEPIDFGNYLGTGEIAMISVGGESYKGARTCNFDWVKKIKYDCDSFGVKFDFHQTGSNFVMNGKRYNIRHKDEYPQAKKGMVYLNKKP